MKSGIEIAKLACYNTGIIHQPSLTLN